ncbi:MAG: peptidylprolyl isomerase [Blastocatellia bacterium]
MKTARAHSRPLIVIILIPIIACLGFCLIVIQKSFTDSSRPETANPEPPSVVATVEGRQISAKLYLMYLKNGIESLGLSDQTDEGRRRINLLKEGIIAELIDRALIESEARHRNLSFTEEKLESERQSRITQMGGEEIYSAYLKESNITDEEFRQIVAGEIYGSMLRQELDKDVSVPQTDIRNFYNKEKQNPKLESFFVEPERVRASHILINTRRAGSADELRKLRARAAEILSRVRAGADFARLAREYSDDTGTRASGGDLGLFTRNTHTKKFDEAAFALKPGQTSQIVETDYGFHIIKVAEHLPSRVKSFNETRSAIEQQLLARARAERLTRWLEAGRRAAKINVTSFYRVGQFLTVDQ